MRKLNFVNGEYFTNNLLEATFLSFKGFNYKVNKEEKQGRVVCYYIFKDRNEIIGSLLDEFWAGSKELQLLDTFREVKKIAVFDGYQKNHYRVGNRKSAS